MKKYVLFFFLLIANVLFSQPDSQEMFFEIVRGQITRYFRKYNPRIEVQENKLLVNFKYNEQDVSIEIITDDKNFEILFNSNIHENLIIEWRAFLFREIMRFVEINSLFYDSIYREEYLSIYKRPWDNILASFKTNEGIVYLLEINGKINEDGTGIIIYTIIEGNYPISYEKATYFLLITLENDIYRLERKLAMGPEYYKNNYFDGISNRSDYLKFKVFSNDKYLVEIKIFEYFIGDKE